MAKLGKNDGLVHLRGKFGDRIYKWYGQTCIVQKLPAKRRSKTSRREKGTHDNLRRGVAYAQSVIADPAATAYYAAAARKLKRPVYLLAKADAMRAPTLQFAAFPQHYDGRKGRVLLIATGDLFRVQTLHITVRDAAGDIVETGAAQRHKKDFVYAWKRDHPRGEALTFEAAGESRAGHRVALTAQASLPAT